MAKTVLMLTLDSYPIDRRILQEAKTLAIKDYNVKILCANYQDSKERKFQIDNISILSIPLKIDVFKNKIKKIFTLKGVEDEIYLKYLKRFSNIDILHIHDLQLLYICKFAKQKLKIPCIYDSHELYTQENINLIKKLYFKIREKKFIKYVDIIITVNKLIKDYLKKLYPQKEIKVIENAIDIKEKLPSVKNKIIQNLNLKENKKILLYQGGIVKNRNLDILIKNFSYLSNDYILILLGSSDNNYKSYLQNIIKNYNLTERIYFIDYIPYEQLLPFTSSADIGIIPYPYDKDLNSYYASPNKLYEYIAAKTPILSNNLAYVKYILEKFNIGKAIDFNSHKEFTKAVEGIINKKDFYKSNLTKAYKEINWQNEGKKLIEVYGSIR